jgi:hypothetical protein
MSKDKTNSDAARARKRHVLLENGIAALVFGIALLFVPRLLDDTPAARNIAQVLWIPASLGIGLGVVLLVLHVLARRNPRVTSTEDAAASPGAKPTEWNAAAVERMDANGFAAVCRNLFTQGGFEPREQPRTSNDSIDLWLYSKHAQGAVAIVRCRHSAGVPVEIDQLRSLLVTTMWREARRGTYVTNATFTDDAVRFAKENRINTLDGDRLLRLIGKRTPQQQAELLAAAYGAEDMDCGSSPQ